MRVDQASTLRDPEYQALLAGISEHRGAPVAAENAAPASASCNVDPYQDPAYNQPHEMAKTLVAAPLAIAMAVKSAALSPAQQACLADCFECHKICLNEAKRVHEAAASLPDPPADSDTDAHLRLLLNCAEICETSAHFLLTGSDFQAMICGVCAPVCEVCAQGCDAYGNLAACADACRQCAAACQKMAQVTA